MRVQASILKLILTRQIVNEEIEFDIILTTYNMVISSADDRVLFRKLDFHYVVFDEAHMLKNMATSRYENLMRVRASRYVDSASQIVFSSGSSFLFHPCVSFPSENSS